MAVAFAVATVAPKTERRIRDGKAQVHTRAQLPAKRRGFSRPRERGRHREEIGSYLDLIFALCPYVVR